MPGVDLKPGPSHPSMKPLFFPLLLLNFQPEGGLVSTSPGWGSHLSVAESLEEATGFFFMVCHQAGENEVQGPWDSYSQNQEQGAAVSIPGRPRLHSWDNWLDKNPNKDVYGAKCSCSHIFLGQLGQAPSLCDILSCCDFFLLNLQVGGKWQGGDHCASGNGVGHWWGGGWVGGGRSPFPPLLLKLCAYTFHLQPLAGKNDTSIQNKWKGGSAGLNEKWPGNTQD